jgi:hypothetical protein
LPSGARHESGPGTIDLETGRTLSVWRTHARRPFLYCHPFASSRAATILWGRLTRGTLWVRPISKSACRQCLATPDQQYRCLRLAAMWGRMASCGGLATRLPAYGSQLSIPSGRRNCALAVKPHRRFGRGHNGYLRSASARRPRAARRGLTPAGFTAYSFVGGLPCQSNGGPRSQ